MLDLRPSCPVCGVVMANAKLHQEFHDALRELSRLVEAPEMSPEEYNEIITAAWAAREATP